MAAGIQPLDQVHRIHFGQQLPGRDTFTLLHQNAADPSRRGRPDQNVAPRFHHADAEQRGMDVGAGRFRGGDLNRTGRAAQDDHRDAGDDGKTGKRESQLTVEGKFHGRVTRRKKVRRYLTPKLMRHSRPSLLTNW